MSYYHRKGKQKHSVYLLLCPFTKFVTYVGVTKGTLTERLRIHITDRVYKDKAMWVDSLLKENKKPEIRLFREFYNRSEAESCESWCIEEFGKLGVRLLNKSKNRYYKNKK
jgi:hypothetical protein